MTIDILHAELTSFRSTRKNLSVTFAARSN